MNKIKCIILIGCFYKYTHATFFWMSLTVVLSVQGQKSHFLIIYIAYITMPEMPGLFKDLVFINPSFTKADWSDDPVCCDWSTIYSTYQKPNVYLQIQILPEASSAFIHTVIQTVTMALVSPY